MCESRLGRIAVVMLAPSVHDPGEHRYWERHVPQDDDRGEAGRETPAPRVEARIVPTQRLEHAPGPVEDVEPEEQVRHDIHDCHRPSFEARYDVLVRLTADEVALRRPPGERAQ